MMNIRIMIFLNFLVIFAKSQVCEFQEWHNAQLQESHNCKVIKGFTLEINNENQKAKLKSIQEIYNGLIISISAHKFDHLPEVVKIENQNGPAIIFTESSSFDEIYFPKLASIIGTPTLQIDSDTLADKAYKTTEMMNSLFKIEARTEPPRQCDADFLKVNRKPLPPRAKKEEDYTGILLYIVVGLCVIVALLDIVLGLKVYSMYKKYKKSQTSKKSKNAKVDPKGKKAV